MLGTKFWEQIASGVANKWGERLLSPALVFWAGGFVAYSTAQGWASVVAFLQRLDTPLQIAFALGALVSVVGSAIAMESIQQGGLRLLEGYWLRPLRPLRRCLIKRTRKRIEKWRTEWRELAQRYDKDLSPEDLETYAHRDAVLATYPLQERLLPTRLGNRLRAAEDYPRRRYGLATGVVWPRLWGVMPKDAQEEIIEARKRLDTAVRLILWSLLFLLWTFWVWWAVPLALLGTAWGYWQALEAAGVYGELLRAAFDLHRFALYDVLR